MQAAPLSKIAALREFITRASQVDGVYAGYPDGAFFQVVNLRSEGWRTALDAPEDAALGIRIMAGGTSANKTERLMFLDAAGTVIGPGLVTLARSASRSGCSGSGLRLGASRLTKMSSWRHITPLGMPVVPPV